MERNSIDNDLILLLLIKADGAGDSFPGASKVMKTIIRNRRALKLDRRTCFSASGNPGYCTTLHSCYPNLSQSQLSVQETWMIISRNKCQFPGENGKGQVSHFIHSFTNNL